MTASAPLLLRMRAAASSVICRNAPSALSLSKWGRRSTVASFTSFFRGYPHCASQRAAASRASCQLRNSRCESSGKRFAAAILCSCKAVARQMLAIRDSFLKLCQLARKALFHPQTEICDSFCLKFPILPLAFSLFKGFFAAIQSFLKLMANVIGVSYRQYCSCHFYTKWARRDSNPEPRDYESPALTVELQARENKTGRHYARAGCHRNEVWHGYSSGSVFCCRKS